MTTKKKLTEFDRKVRKLFYRRVLHALDRLNPKVLSIGQLTADGKVCPLGALWISEHIAGRVEPEDFEKIFNYDVRKTIAEAYEHPFANELWQQNDNYELNESPKQRYTRMYNWVKEQSNG